MKTAFGTTGRLSSPARVVVDGILHRETDRPVEMRIDLQGRHVVPPYAEPHTHLLEPDAFEAYNQLFLSRGIFYVRVPGGVDRITHFPGVGYDPELGEASFRITEEDARQAARRGVSVETTLSGLFQLGSPAAISQETRRYVDSVIRPNLEKLRAAGVKILVGADGWHWSVGVEAAVLLELGLFDEASVLRTLTVDNAQSIFPERKIGSLSEGFEASFLVLEGNPLDDFANTQRIALRIKEGRILLPREIPFPQRRKLDDPPDDDESDSLKFEAEIPLPVDEAYAMWLDPVEASTFLAEELLIEPRVGGRYEVKFDPQNDPAGALQGTYGSKILALEPPQRLVFQWHGLTPPAAAAQVDGLQVHHKNTVEVKFEARGPRRTRIRIRHFGFGDDQHSAAAKRFHRQRGWPWVINRLRGVSPQQRGSESTSVSFSKDQPPLTSLGWCHSMQDCLPQRLLGLLLGPELRVGLFRGDLLRRPVPDLSSMTGVFARHEIERAGSRLAQAGH